MTTATIRHMTHEAEGAYGFRYSRHLAIDTTTGKGLLIEDEWCGAGVEGECYRPHAYRLDAATTRAAVAAWDNQPLADNPDCTAWEQWAYDYAQALAGGSLGRWRGEVTDTAIEAALAKWARA